MSLDKANKTPIQIYKVPELGKFHTDFDFWLIYKRIPYKRFCFLDGDLSKKCTLALFNYFEENK